MVLVVLFSSAVTLVLTAIQLYLDYNRDIEVIEDRLIEIEQVHQRSLGTSLWVADYGSLATQLRGIVKLPDMQYLALHENGEVIVSVGTPEDRNVIAREFSIEHDFRGETREIGRLTTVATVTGVYQRLFQRALGILASNAVKTFLVAGFMLLLLQRLVVSRLGDFAEYLRIHAGENIPPRYQPPPDDNRHDELDEVFDSFNDVNQRLGETLSSLQRSERRFRGIAENVGDLVWISSADWNSVY